MTTVVLLAFAMGVVAGLRTMMAPALTSWAAHLGAIDPASSGFAFMASRYTVWLMTALAAGELVTDQLPSTPSRMVPPQFAGRLMSGALCGGTIGSSAGAAVAGALVGAIGAIVGTLGGAAFRSRLAAGFGNDHPAALVEDATAIAVALALAWMWGRR